MQSERIAPNAAKQGIDNWLNSIKLKAETEVKIELAYSTIVGSSAPTSPKPATTPKVETTTSFATKPVIVATVAAQ